MRIIFVESIHNFGGSGKSTIDLSSNLLSAGHEVLIVDFWGSCEAHSEECKTKNIPFQILDKRDFPISLREKSIKRTLWNYLQYFPKMSSYKKKICEIIRTFKPDLISVNNTKTLSIVPSSEHYKIAYFARGWFLPHTLSRLTKNLLRKRVDIFLTVSESTKQMVYANGFAELSDIYIINDAVNIEEFANVSNKISHVPWHLRNKGSFIMLHCGTFIKTKGQHISVEVLKRLRDKNIDVKLIITGLVATSEESKTYLQHILDLIKLYDLEEYVQTVVNQNNVLQYFAVSDVLIHPSFSEGLPRVALEAMVLGKPVIGNAVGGMTDLISNNFTGFLPNFNVVDEYVEYIEELVGDKRKYERISCNASNLVSSNYTIKHQIDAFERIRIS